MSNGYATGARPILDRAGGVAPVLRYKITALEFLHKISKLSSFYSHHSLRSRLCYKISGPRNTPFL